MCRLKENTPCPSAPHPFPSSHLVSVMRGLGVGPTGLGEALQVPQAGEPTILWVKRFLRLFPPPKGVGHGHFVRSFVGHHSLQFSRMSVRGKVNYCPSLP